MIEQHNVITRSIRTLQEAGTIVISCTRQELLILLAEQILTDLTPVPQVCRGQFILGYNLDTDRVRTLAELVILTAKDQDDLK